MKLFYTALLMLMIGLSGCEPQEHHAVTSNKALNLRYQASAEAMFTDIQVVEGVLSYTFFVDTDNRCAQWFKSTPCWTTDDLETVTRPLDSAELDKLSGVVEQSGVMSLTGDQFGETNLRRRAYTETLTVVLEDAERVLRYRSTPDAEEKPAAFAVLEKALRDHASALYALQK